MPWGWSSFASLTRGLSSRDFYLARNSAETFEQHMLGLIKQVNMTRSSLHYEFLFRREPDNYSENWITDSYPGLSLVDPRYGSMI